MKDVFCNRKMLNEAGINKNTLRDMAEKVMWEEIEKQVKNAINQSNINSIVYSKVNSYELNDMMRAAIKKEISEAVDIKINVTAAIDTISAAIQKVSTQRSALGAVQNRLEHTINNLDNVVENTTSAESAIRDTNMATEMVKYSNNNILAQAGQAMLAQANQSNQGVLSLLQ